MNVEINGPKILGYLFGNVEFIKKNLSMVLIGIVALSFMPACIEYLRTRLAPVGSAKRLD